MKTLKMTLVSLLFGLLCVPLSQAQDITLQWDASPDPGITGYKIHYQAVSSTIPFTGSGALEGASPVDSGVTTATTLSGLRDDVVYYFAVTSYDSSGNESTYSNIVASAIPTLPPVPGEWFPELYYPDNGASNVALPVQFNWSEPTITTGVTYTLYYGTDPNLDPGTLASAPLRSVPGMAPLTAGVCLFGLLGATFKGRRFFPGGAALLLVASILVINGCGAGDGTGTAPTAPGNVSETTPADPGGGSTPAPYTVVVSGLGDSYYDAYDLEPGTTYYWKVVVDDGMTKVESQRFSFTTETL